MLRLNLVAAATTLALTLSATAGDKGPRYVLGPSKLPKSYPIFEHKYIKGIPGPSVACGSCFGYHHTQWRPWAEACNEPQQVIVDAGSPQATMPPATPMEPAKNGNGNGSPKAEPKKDESKKENTSITIPSVPAPRALPKPQAQPKPTTNFEIVVPPAPAVPANAIKPTGFAPTVIVPVPSK